MLHDLEDSQADLAVGVFQMRIEKMELTQGRLLQSRGRRLANGNVFMRQGSEVLLDRPVLKEENCQQHSRDHSSSIAGPCLRGDWQR